MRVVVTGAGGRIGTVVGELLRNNGFDVLGLDRVDGSAVRRVDLRELDQVTEALAGAQAVVHLAAIPSPKDDPPEVVYGNNTVATFHVFEATKDIRCGRRIPTDCPKWLVRRSPRRMPLAVREALCRSAFRR